MHLNEESQTALKAACDMITDGELVRQKGLCTIGTALDIVVYDASINTRHPKYYRLSIPAHATVQFWPAGDMSSAYSREHCTLYDPAGMFRVIYNAKCARQPFLLMWRLGVIPTPTVELVAS